MPPRPTPDPLRPTYREARATWERTYFQELIAATGNNMSAAARVAGLDRSHFYQVLKRLGIGVRDPAERAIYRARFLGKRGR